MYECRVDMWRLEGDAYIVTTNGFVKRNGRAVMGKGCAREARDRYPGIDLKLGMLLQKCGNIPLIINREPTIVSLPVKPVSEVYDGTNAVKHMQHKFRIGDIVPGWACKSNLLIVAISLAALKGLVNRYAWQKVVMPRPGCGNGELSYKKDVGPLLKMWLDDRFIVCHK